MKIVIVQGAFFPVPAVKGGAVEKIWFELGKAFARDGHSVTHISKRTTEFANFELIEEVNHIRVPGFRWQSSYARNRLRDLLYSILAFAKIPKSNIIVTN